jgi:2-keto-3-deoxy-galactonokinase
MIGIDWGTSSLRAFRIAADGRVKPGFAVTGRTRRGSAAGNPRISSVSASADD